jgi:hypothetical protein
MDGIVQGSGYAARDMNFPSTTPYHSLPWSYQQQHQQSGPNYSQQNQQRPLSHTHSNGFSLVQQSRDGAQQHVASNGSVDVRLEEQIRELAEVNVSQPNTQNVP